MANRDEVLEVAKRLTDEMQSTAFVDKFRTTVDDKGMLFQNQLFELLEEIQVETLTSWKLSCDGAKMLQHLKMAVKSFPDETCKMQMMMLVSVEEKLLDDIQREVAKKHGIELPDSAPPAAEAGSHGHSHDGKPCHGHGGNQGSHGHSHGGSHGHSHGGSHGHSHNGQPCHGHGHGNMPKMSPQQMAAMQMAMSSLNEQQKRDMQSMQMKMMTGQPPSREDQQKMQAIQQHVAAYMQTMQAALQGAQAQAQQKK